ncbi:23S rRNA (uracil1939-C5)-methyltransferase [Pseudochelatococcus lubricantis]|uniref:23S rRNA (Uracil1939-C5)-methyltransferase n=1 Tax=Pseudochelatococcus lubricantis TaxID=1538102 RepID=A0ABX0V737_9HYPH|nr:class I SAM-dependent RNA methyltransferase [Pseudochelatococcus lubricantis]NIJ59590.1 23S rRNA (uracil1939-C5)-methyltransferase [Pseudochelatococcus lubricantis]
MTLDATLTLTIARLGARGDGIADTPAGPVYVPYALPGETVRVSLPAPDPSTGRAARSSMGRADARAALIAVEHAAPDRRAPECVLFTRCGGCVTQHMSEATYGAWKRDSVVTALARAGIDTPVEPLVDAHGTGRRRVTFHGRRRQDADGVDDAVGFMAARSHDLVPVAHCPVLDPALARAPAVALDLARLLLPKGKPLDIQITATTSGLDIDVRGHGPAGEVERRVLTGAAERLDLARLSIHGDLVVERRPPGIAMGRGLVTPPAGGFLQATALGEETLARLVTEACDSAPGRIKRAADLFAGCGPFALRLAERAEVHAVESAAAALAALDRAFRATPGLRRITTEARDLFRRPLLPLELNRYDAVVFDPPRAGAEAQAREIAKSQVPLVVAVSCDAGTFARDAKILTDGGYAAARITPVDQFRHSPHVEMVGVFVRTGKARRR